MDDGILEYLERDDGNSCFIEVEEERFSGTLRIRRVEKARDSSAPPYRAYFACTDRRILQYVTAKMLGPSTDSGKISIVLNHVHAGTEIIASPISSVERASGVEICLSLVSLKNP